MAPNLLNASDWERLKKGQTIGKRMNMAFNALRAGVDLFTLRGDDDVAMPLRITLCSPQVIIGVTPGPTQDLQTMTGEQDNFDSASAYPWTPIVGELEWGVGGANAKASVDFINGGKICIEGSFVRLRAGVEPVTFFAGSPVGVYTLSAFICRGEGTSRAQRTVPLGTLAAGGVAPASGLVPVPRFAKTVSLFAQDWSTTISWDLQFFRDRNGANLIGFHRFNGASGSNALAQGGIQLAVPNGAMFFNVSSNAQPSDNVEAVFDLAI